MKKLVENLREVKTLYKIICNRELNNDAPDTFRRVSAVRYLEEITKQKFNNAKDLKEKMDKFIFEQEKRVIEEGIRDTES